ncbi:MAG: hypothetical protein KAW12_13080 [Candidatus Aminicenantes bacterium]|nr:hypothetical protein [Candidatus Aminicenantes bacterium]
MEEKAKLTAEITRLKKEIYARKEAAAGIKELLKSEIDRDFPVDLWELSPRELDDRMGLRLSFLNDDIDTRPDPAAITSHRRILGKPIVFVKKIIMKFFGAYTNSILDKQRHFNEQLVVFHLGSFIRFKENERKLKEIEERISEFEENQELALDELKNIRQRLGSLSGGAVK